MNYNPNLFELQMFLHNRKRINLSVEEKIWILRHAEKNDKLSRKKIALDFSTKFNRSITSQCVSYTISKKLKFWKLFKPFLIFNPENFEKTWFLLIVSFSRAQKRETKWGNETKCGGLKQLEEIGDFLPFVSISLKLVKLKKNEETEDLFLKCKQEL